MSASSVRQTTPRKCCKQRQRPPAPPLQSRRPEARRNRLHPSERTRTTGRIERQTAPGGGPQQDNGSCRAAGYNRRQAATRRRGRAGQQVVDGWSVAPDNWPQQKGGPCRAAGGRPQRRKAGGAEKPEAPNSWPQTDGWSCRAAGRGRMVGRVGQRAAPDSRS